MSATVRPLERDCVFWFCAPTRVLHAFELVEGELEPLSVCGKAELEPCGDEPVLEARERVGRMCMFCLAGAA